jgi:hypothetical protein
MKHFEEVLEYLDNSLRIDETGLGNLLQVDSRSPRRWLDGTAKPSGTARTLLESFGEALERSPREESRPSLFETLLRAAADDEKNGLLFLVRELCRGWHDSPAAREITAVPPPASSDLAARVRAEIKELAHVNLCPVLRRERGAMILLIELPPGRRTQHDTTQRTRIRRRYRRLFECQMDDLYLPDRTKDVQAIGAAYKMAGAPCFRRLVAYRREIGKKITDESQWGPLYNIIAECIQEIEMAASALAEGEDNDAV